MLSFIFWSFFSVICIFVIASQLENAFIFSKTKEEDEVIHFKNIKYNVTSASDAERVDNLENLTVNFGIHKGKQWKDIPTNYLNWMLAEDHRYSQIAQVLIAARQCDYQYV